MMMMMICEHAVDGSLQVLFVMNLLLVCGYLSCCPLLISGSWLCISGWQSARATKWFISIMNEKLSAVKQTIHFI